MTHSQTFADQPVPRLASRRTLVRPKCTNIKRPETTAAVDLLLWHWGKAGAGSKFTYEMALALSSMADLRLCVSVSAGSDLERLCKSQPNLRTDVVPTFSGDKRTIQGKVRAAGSVLSMPRLAQRFSRILHTRRPGVVLCTFQSIWDITTFPALRQFEGRFILVLHDARFHPGDGYPFRSSVLRQQVAEADALIVLSDHVGCEAQNIFGFPGDRIWTIPHGIFVFGEARDEPRTFPSDRPVRLLFLGRIVAYKGLHLLLESYRILRRRGLAIELHIVGDGDMAPYRESLVKLPDVTIVNRWLDDKDIAGALRHADAVVLPYTEASQSGVAAAALAAALPIVATPVGGLVEQVCHGETGVIAAEVSALALANAVSSLVSDGELYRRCSGGAARYAREQLDWSKIATQVANVIEDVSARPKRRSMR